MAAEEGVPEVLWSVLIFGGIAAVGFTYLFRLENTWAHPANGADPGSGDQSWCYSP